MTSAETTVPAHRRVGQVAAWPAIALIRLYKRLISPLLGPRCRFTPTCSSYALTCLQHHGLIRGGWLAASRIARCHPFNPGGYDPPPVGDAHACCGHDHGSEAECMADAR